MNTQKPDLEKQMNEVLQIVGKLFPQLATSQTQESENFRTRAAEMPQKAEENQKLALDFTHDAKTDLHAFKKLHKNRLYAPSIYHLQQATEKANKAWGLAFGLVDKSDFQKIRHKTPMILLKILKEKWTQPLLLLIKQAGPSFTTDISPLLQLIDQPSNQITKMSEAEIQSLLVATNTIDNMDSSIDSILATITESLDPTIKLPKIGRLTCLGMSLFVLGVVTFPHEAYTRYSDGDTKTGELLPKDYNSNLGIVKAAPDIEKKLSSEIQLLDKLLNQLA